jgi:hypothetical protein
VTLCAAFFAVAFAQARWVDVDVHTHDQSAYLQYAITQVHTHYEALGNRMQMPVYPALHSLFLGTYTTPEEAFAHAKMVAIGLGAIATLGVWALLLFTLERAQAIAIGIVYTLYIAAFRSAYVQCEPVYYALFFAAFVACASIWERPSIPKAIVAGAVAALAWLTKGSMLVGAEIFIAITLVRALVLAKRTRFRESALDAGQAIVFAASFFALVYPYAKNSKEHYGEWLYNMSTKYVVWCDSWETFLNMSATMPPHSEWQHLPSDKVPSLANYVHAHSVIDMIVREVRGLALVAGNAMIGPGYQLFAILWLGWALWLLRDEKLRLRVFERSPHALWIFAVPWLALQAIALGFYADIAAGNRFSLAFFLPSVWCIHRAMQREEPRWEDATKRTTQLALVSAIALPILAPLLYSGR